ISTCFSRAPWPVAMRTALGGRANDLAMRRTMASLASPSIGGAVTRTLRKARPSTSRAQPSIRSRPPRGVRRTARRNGSAAGHRRYVTEHPGDQVLLRGLQDDDGDDRADVEAAQSGDHTLDRPQ